MRKNTRESDLEIIKAIISGKTQRAIIKEFKTSTIRVARLRNELHITTYKLNHSHYIFENSNLTDDYGHAF